jgi:acetyl-CoA acetyltransferase
MNNDKIVVLDGARMPIGSFGGMFKDVPAFELGATAAGLEPASVNPYGGAIALGHPVGATGANLTLRVAKDMVRRDLEFGIVTMCIGGGQALAALFRRV